MRLPSFVTGVTYVDKVDAMSTKTLLYAVIDPHEAHSKRDKALVLINKRSSEVLFV